MTKQLAPQEKSLAMSAADFRAFADWAKVERGWTHNHLCDLLGCGENQIGLWCRDGVMKTYVKLACAALVAGVDDWRSVPRAWVAEVRKGRKHG